MSVENVPVEVEGKFSVPDNIKAVLNEVGAKLTKSHIFHDVYVDDKSHTLALSDLWLRRRDGEWQLKFPPEQRIRADVNQYKETNDVLYIQQYVSRALNKPQTDLNDLLPYCHMTTYRTKYMLDQAIIDLDLTDFGYNVGEVEVITDSGGIQSAVMEVDRVIQLLGVESLTNVQGKMMVYLKTHNLHLFEKVHEMLENKKRSEIQVT